MSRLGRQRGGEETYCINLARGLARIDPTNEYYLYLVSPSTPPVVDHANFHHRVVGPPSPWIRIPLTLPLAARRDRIDVLHVVHVVPPICPSRAVITAFDASYEAHPAHYPLALRLRLSMLVPYSVRRAARVLTISEYSKRELIQQYRLPADKVEVVSCGVDTELFRPIPHAEARDRLRARYSGLDESFLLYLGSLQPRKNLPRLIEAFALLDGEAGKDRQLVVVGKWKWLTVEVQEALDRFGLRDRVRFTGHVPTQDLPLLLNSAAAMVFPSLYEGFGLPVLEAMACGTPVVCSNATSLPEVARGAAEFVDPYDVEDIARGLHAVLSSPARRAELRQQGLQRATAFTWEETARRALRVFTAVAGQR